MTNGFKWFLLHNASDFEPPEVGYFEFLVVVTLLMHLNVCVCFLYSFLRALECCEYSAYKVTGFDIQESTMYVRNTNMFAWICACFFCVL